MLSSSMNFYSSRSSTESYLVRCSNASVSAFSWCASLRRNVLDHITERRHTGSLAPTHTPTAALLDQQATVVRRTRWPPGIPRFAATLAAVAFAGAAPLWPARDADLRRGNS